MRTDFVLDALEQALYDRRPQRDGALIHHSDRGSQYVSIRYSERLAEAGIEPSVGRRGDSYDNARFAAPQREIGISQMRPHREIIYRRRRHRRLAIRFLKGQRLQCLAEPAFGLAPIEEPNDCLMSGSVSPTDGGRRQQSLHQRHARYQALCRLWARNRMS